MTITQLREGMTITQLREDMTIPSHIKWCVSQEIKQFIS